jgi:drug/metabolite transporter (DMT)-like permease
VRSLDELQMTFVALGLIVAAAFLHAGWNYLAKASRDTMAFMWWAVALGTFGYGLWIMIGPGISLASASWIPFLISQLAEVGYYVTLVRGYSQGDLSLVYPISRGSAPIFSVLWSAIVLAERLPWLGYLGVALMVAGVYIAPLTFDRGVKFTFSALAAPFRNHAAAWSLASALFISIYSVSDKVAVSATPPLVYNWWVFAGNALLWMPIAWPRSRFRTNIDELRNNWLAVVAGSAMTIVAYLAVLYALALTSASYVVAGRGLSVIIGAIFGSVMLKENVGPARITGALLMVSGLSLVAFA